MSQQSRFEEPIGNTPGRAPAPSAAMTASPGVVRNRRARRSSAGASRQRRPRHPVVTTHDEIRHYVDRDGRQHFNFTQKIWLDPAVTMACTRVHSTALTTLAVNLLSLVLRTRDYQAAIGTSSRRAVALARDFSDDCLLTAPGAAWVMPRAAIKAWLASHRRPCTARSARNQGHPVHEPLPIGRRP